MTGRDPDHTLRVNEIRLRERPVRLRLPFRYGNVTLREAPQAFAMALVETASGAAWGVAAEMLAPKWFDKNPALSDAQNMDQLRLAVALALPCYLRQPPASAYELSREAHGHVLAAAGPAGLNALSAAFGPALLDRAVLDGLCRAAGISFFEAMRRNLAGIDVAGAATDLRGFHGDAFLASLAPLPRLHARHTIGLLDPLDHADPAGEAADDALPRSLAAVIARYGQRWFKVKIGGDPGADLARLAAVARTLDGAIPDGYHVTLDGNEQYRSAAAFADFLARMGSHAALGRLCAAVAFVEQPLAREVALEQDVSAIARTYPVIIDESDAGLDAFVTARARGYAGVSSKQCKGLYKSIINAARCVHWNAQAGAPRHFMSGEDLTCQGGVSVQQDLALVSLLGIRHVERNGHHFAGPMPGASPAEHRAFLRAHPDLYEDLGGLAALRIRGGEIEVGSLQCAGFAHAADPDPRTLAEMQLAAP